VIRVLARRALLAVALAVPAASMAQGPHFELKPVPAPAPPGTIPLYPAGSLPQGAVPESWARLVADFPDGHRIDQRIVRNVAVPTITPVLPDPAHATGAAVVIAPGGAFLSLSIDPEGFAVARWFADHGIAAFVLKYRLNPTPADDREFMAVVDRTMAAATNVDKVPDLTAPHAAQDALQALKLVRAGAATWKIDPARVGMIGFSAGAMTELQATLSGDAAARPAFMGYIYGPMTAVAVPAGAPPMFAALALDDPLFGRQGFGIVEAWHKAGVPVELHAYQRGDHGFGMGRPGTTTVLVMDEFRLWLDGIGMLGKRGPAR
jgi:acetyl esterase/lipase